MRRLAAVFLALFALTAPPAIEAASAASAEDAIKAWLATAPPDWTVSYSALTYDPASDRTALSGFAASTQAPPTNFTIDSLVVVGYATTPDGSFAAKSFDLDGGKITSRRAELTFTGVALTEVTIGALAPITFDESKPFSSLVQLYANLLKIQLSHAAIGSIRFNDPDSETEFSYTDFAVDGLADGKVASFTAGSMDLGFIDPDTNDPVYMQLGGFTGKALDFDAMMRLYDPTRYANGEGDGIWRPALGLAEYNDLTMVSSEFDLYVGRWAIEDVKVRQPKRSFTAALDAVTLAAAANEEPREEDMRGLFDFLASFSIGKMAMSDLSIQGEFGTTELAGFTISDLSAEGIGSIVFDSLSVNAGDAYADIGRLAAAGIVFPAIEKLADAFLAAVRDEDVDPDSLYTRLGSFEGEAIRFKGPDIPEEVAINSFRLALDKYVGALPTDVSFEVRGFDAPVELFKDEDDDSPMNLRNLNYQRIVVDYGLKMAWNEADETVTIDGVHLAIGDFATFSGKAVFSGLPRGALSDVERLRDVIANMRLESASLTIDDESLFGRLIAVQAFLEGKSQDQMRQEIIAMIPEIVADFDEPFQKQVAAALTTFVQRPGRFVVSADPPDPVSVGDSAFLMFLPFLIPDVLGLQVVAEAGPVPMPFPFVPPPGLKPYGNGSTSGSGDRHNPNKKYE